MSTKYLSIPPGGEFWVVKVYVTLWGAYCYSKLLEAVRSSYIKNGYRPDQQIPFLVLCLTPAPVLVVFWLHNISDRALLYKLTPVVDAVWVMVEFYICIRRIPWKLLQRGGLIFKCTTTLAVLSTAVMILFALVILIQGPYDPIDLPFILAVELFALFNIMNQLTAYYVTGKLLRTSPNAHTRSVMKMLCNISIICCGAHISAMFRAATDAEIFDACGIAIGSYTFIQYGNLLSAKNSGFLDKDSRQDVPSTSKTLAHPTEPKAITSTINISSS